VDGVSLYSDFMDKRTPGILPKRYISAGQMKSRLSD
jgi:hypothetical protein